MTSQRKRGAGGFTLIEMVVVVVAIAILMGFALDRLLPLLGRAERVAFIEVQGTLQSALLLEAAERITRGAAHELPELAAGNPMALLLRPPQNYLGSIEGFEPAELPRASWYYDEREAKLVYRVGKHTRFQALEGPPERIELRVSFVFRDRDADGAFDAAYDAFDGLKLASLHAYEWPD